MLNSYPYQHGDEKKIGVLLVNLGSPDAPEPGAVKRYLKQFLSDPRVIELPAWKWQPILRGFILPRRSKASAEAYRTVWTEKGSPLVAISQELGEKIKQRFSNNPYLQLEVAMTYGHPSIKEKIANLLLANCEYILILPLYPQYASCTTGSVFAQVSDELNHTRKIPHLNFINSYVDAPGYISTLAQSIQADLKPDSDLLVFSYHGTPHSMLHMGDPYHCHCHKTSRLVAQELGLAENKWMTCFQSRFGKARWLEPYTIETMHKLPTQAIKNIQVVCPSFSIDCLETIEEINIENREAFMEAGGEDFSYIPALNASDMHVDFLCSLISSNIAEPLARFSQYNQSNQRKTQSQLARACSHNQADTL